MDLVSHFLFPTPPASYKPDSFPGELLCIPRSLNPQTSSNQDYVPLLLLQSSNSRDLVIYLHSNSDDLGRCHRFCRALRDELKVHVLAVEYPGYGLCPGGQCNELGAMESANTAFRFVQEVLRWPVENTILMGRSVGSGPAVALALEHAVGGLVLITPFLSVREVCRDALGPVANLIAERFPNMSRMPFVQAPCLFVHGQKDVTVLPRHGQKLYDLCQTRKRLVSPANMDHNASLLTNREHLIYPMTEFFGLPAVCAGGRQLVVPGWAFDRRIGLPAIEKLGMPGLGDHRCPQCRSCGLQPHCAPRPLLMCGQSSGTCVAYGGRSTPSSGVPQVVQQAYALSGSPYFVQDTIAEAVEHILAGGAEEDGRITPVLVEERTQWDEPDEALDDDVAPMRPHLTPHMMPSRAFGPVLPLASQKRYVIEGNLGVPSVVSGLVKV